MILGFFSVIGRGTLLQTRNYSYNCEVMNRDEFAPFRKGCYIENQTQWKEVRFGCGRHHNMAYSGCEVIACYNAILYLTGRKSECAETMCALIRRFERKGAALLGDFGVNPRELKHFFLEENYRTKFVIGSDSIELDRMAEETGCVLVTLFNNREAVTDYVHTMTVTREADGYYLHNAYGNAIGPADKASELIERYDSRNGKKSLIICMLGVDKG